MARERSRERFCTVDNPLRGYLSMARVLTVNIFASGKGAKCAESIGTGEH